MTVLFGTYPKDFFKKKDGYIFFVWPIKEKSEKIYQSVGATNRLNVWLIGYSVCSFVSKGIIDPGLLQPNWRLVIHVTFV